MSFSLIPALSMRITLVFFLLACTALEACATTPQWRFPATQRVVAVSDIHGDYGALRRVLTAAGVVDEAGAWSGGATRFVVAGDILDRGPDSRRVMDWLLKLELQAEQAGGGVHVVLGNHEMMNLTGDMRYVSAGEYAAFAADETPAERASAMQRYATREGVELTAPATKEKFDNLYPPGFFAHRRAFAPDGRYGHWLLSLPLLLVIEHTAFVHGGLGEETAQMDGDSINGPMREDLVEYVGLLSELIAAGILTPETGFHDQVEAARASVETAPIESPLHAQVERLAALRNAPVFGTASPAWYRGSVACGAFVQQDDIEAALARLDAQRLVVGHTPAPGVEILQRMNGRVLRVDTGMLNAYYGGHAAALVLEDDGASVTVVTEDGKAGVPVPQSRRVGNRLRMGDDALEALLAQGEITALEPLEDGLFRAVLDDSGAQVAAIFTPGARRQKSFTEVAAYRLDRLLGLDMVPVAVLRELDGRTGSLQVEPTHTVSEAQRQAEGGGAGAWCALGEQHNAMYLFDALIYNEGRTLESIHYQTDNWNLVLLGHARSFGKNKTLPPHLRQTRLDKSAVLLSALAALDQESLARAMEGVLSTAQIRALLQRRDGILAKVD